MKTIVVLSGKGGAGKTSVAAGLLPFMRDLVIADADVDASNLPLLLGASPTAREEFFGGHKARVDPSACDGCGICAMHCRFAAISPPAPELGRGIEIDELGCEGCGVCRQVCPHDAVSLVPVVTGEWMLSRTAFGPLSHARLGPGGDNSGALVAKVRREASELARRERRAYVLVDGPPGIGCPAISSLTGADLALLVTEPTPSGESDLGRVLELTHHFGIPSAVVINKADLNPERSDALTARVELKGARVLARMPYCDDVRRAILEARILSANPGPWRKIFADLWRAVRELLESSIPEPRHV